MKSDRYMWFRDVYNTPEYFKVIKYPMCLNTMKEKIEYYMVDAELF